MGADDSRARQPALPPESQDASWQPSRLAAVPTVPVWTLRSQAVAPEVVVTAASGVAETAGVAGPADPTGAAKTAGVPLALGSWAQAHAGVLSPAERARAARFATPELAGRWSAAQVLLRVVLAAQFDADPAALRFERTAAGKPMLGGEHKGAVRFSLAHTEDWVLIAVSSGHAVSPNCALGIDAEPRVTHGVAAELACVFTPGEQDQLAGLREEVFPAATTQLWTRKEAYLKALGTGLLRDPSLDTIGAGQQPRIPADAPAGTTITDLPLLPGSAVHVALCVIDRLPDCWCMRPVVDSRASHQRSDHRFSHRQCRRAHR